MSPDMSPDPALRNVLGQLTNDLGLGPPESIVPLRGGRNNRVFRIETGSRPVLLKQYYRDPHDPRDRLAADFGFSRYAWGHGVRTIAEPLAANPQCDIALYAFIEGPRLQPADVTPARVREALDFVVGLNSGRRTPAAAALPYASEACFSIAAHVGTVETRVRRLQEACAGRAHEESTVVARLAFAWQRIRRYLVDRDDARPLPVEARCLSPSDFGFHNAIAHPHRGLVFHDFEYAGWDDPAKLVGDFFSQVEVPPPPHLLDDFTGTLFDALGLSRSHRHRVRVLLPVLRVKWCCIVLNDFLPEAARRRRFAASSSHPEDPRPAQLRCADRLISSIERDLDGVH
jgi:hypothetical protein